ncbi:hypothetical protein LCGC14_0560390 [marine sediment metagenome]|uniref:BRCT domain-containing protein n=1 Tax=marine sediment metagenome TaxID=412755 RepID=A0A0F9U8T5_9ZZZZ
MVSVGYITIKIKNSKWYFENIRRRSILGTKKFLYVGEIQDPIKGKMEIEVMAKNTIDLKKIVKAYILRLL